MFVPIFGRLLLSRCQIWVFAAVVIQALSMGMLGDSFPYGWGGNVVGQVGNGTLSDVLQPVAIASRREVLMPSDSEIPMYTLASEKCLSISWCGIRFLRIVTRIL